MEIALYMPVLPDRYFQPCLAGAHASISSVEPQQTRPAPVAKIEAAVEQQTEEEQQPEDGQKLLAVVSMLADDLHPCHAFCWGLLKQM